MAPAGDAASLNDGIVQAGCGLDQSSMWDLLLNPDNSVEIYNDLTHLCLSPAGGSATSGAPIVQYRCDGDPSRNWTINRLGAGTLRFQDVHSGLCLAEAGGASPGALLVQSSCDFADASTGWYQSYGVQMRDNASGLCAWWTVNDLNMEVAQEPCNVTRTFRLLVNGAGQGYVRENDYHQFCLSPAGGGMAMSTPIVQYYCDNDSSRQWVVVAAGSGSYAIRDLHSALCLEPAGRSTAAGAVLVQDPCDGNASTLWTLTPARVLPQG